MKIQNVSLNNYKAQSLGNGFRLLAGGLGLLAASAGAACDTATPQAEIEEIVTADYIDGGLLPKGTTMPPNTVDCLLVGSQPDGSDSVRRVETRIPSPAGEVHYDLVVSRGDGTVMSDARVVYGINPVSGNTLRTTTGISVMGQPTDNQIPNVNRVVPNDGFWNRAGRDVRKTAAGVVEDLDVNTKSASAWQCTIDGNLVSKKVVAGAKQFVVFVLDNAKSFRG